MTHRGDGGFESPVPALRTGPGVRSGTSETLAGTRDFDLYRPSPLPADGSAAPDRGPWVYGEACTTPSSDFCSVETMSGPPAPTPVGFFGLGGVVRVVGVVSEVSPTRGPRRRLTRTRLGRGSPVVSALGHTCPGARWLFPVGPRALPRSGTGPPHCPYDEPLNVYCRSGRCARPTPPLRGFSVSLSRRSESRPSPDCQSTWTPSPARRV